MKTHILNVFSELQGTLSKAPEQNDAEYWCNANTSLTKGYELPVPLQNILDEINGALSDQFRNQVVDVSTVTQESFQQLVNSIDLTRLGMFIGHKGIDHHYHLIAGMGSQSFRLDVDLKCIPTVIGPFGSIAASICFLSGKLVVGDVIYQDVTIKYIGLKSLETHHQSVIEHGKDATNDQLGKWLRLIRSINIDEFPALISCQSK